MGRPDSGFRFESASAHPIFPTESPMLPSEILDRADVARHGRYMP
jgi:hypothetical protein